MDRRWAQDVLRCRVCETPGPPLHCDICRIYLCKSCVGEHLLDQSKEHRVVAFKKQGLTTKCSKHSTQLCDIYCEECDIPFCLECVSNNEHFGHKQVRILNTVETKKKALMRDLQELENLIYPKYQDIASNIQVQKDGLVKNSKNLTAAINKHGVDLHREIDTIIKNMKSDLNEIESEHLTFLNKQEDEITSTISEITQSIDYLNKLLNSNDVRLVFAYKSRISEFRRLPSEVNVSLPMFTPQKIDKKNY